MKNEDTSLLLHSNTKWTEFLEYIRNDHKIKIKSKLKKDSLFIKGINLFLKTTKITKDFMKYFVTVIGNTLYANNEHYMIPEDKNEHMTYAQLSIYSHEIAHIIQRKKYGKLNFYCKYLLSQRMRNIFELEAYTISLFVEYVFMYKIHEGRNINARELYLNQSITLYTNIMKSSYNIKDKNKIQFFNNVLHKFKTMLFQHEIENSHISYESFKNLKAKISNFHGVIVYGLCAYIAKRELSRR
jgi:hypothetical protein